MSAIDFDDDHTYEAWLNAHPLGFVINAARPARPRYLILHRSSCHTITALLGNGKSWTGDMTKIGCDTKADAMQWCQSRFNTEPSTCGTCSP